MALRTPMPSGRADGIVWLLYAIGFSGVASHFWINTYGGVGWMLRNRRPPPAGHPRPDPGVWHAVQALMYLVVSLGLGVHLAFSPESELTNRLAPLYGIFGLLGFFGQLVVGVEARILSMFAAYYANRNALSGRPGHQATSDDLTTSSVGRLSAVDRGNSAACRRHVPLVCNPRALGRLLALSRCCGHEPQHRSHFPIRFSETNDPGARSPSIHPPDSVGRAAYSSRSAVYRWGTAPEVQV